MKDLLSKKYKVSPAFREKLKLTRNNQIYHSVEDNKWGIGSYTTDISHPLKSTSIKGLNLFGILLMEVRDSNGGVVNCPGINANPPPYDDTDFPPLSANSTQSMRNDGRSYAAVAQHITPTRSAGPVIPTPPIAPVQNNQSTPRACLIGTSIIQDVDNKRLSHVVSVSKSIANTIDDALHLKLEDIENELVILQLTTNDLKVNSTEKVIKDMQHLINQMLQVKQTCNIAILLSPLQRTFGDMNSKIKIVNSSLEYIFRNSTRVSIHSNNNIHPNVDCYTSDGIHLNHKGSSMLANNIRTIIHEHFKIKNGRRQASYHYHDY
jgi:hypothetical protein